MVRLTAGRTYAQHPPHTDFRAIAEHTLREVRGHEQLVEELDDISRELNQRIRKGYRWIDENSSFHPKYQRALDLIAELQDEHSGTRWKLRDRKIELMGHRLTFWQAWQELTEDDQQEIVDEYGNVSDIPRPDHDTWRTFMENWQAEEIELDKTLRRAD